MAPQDYYQSTLDQPGGPGANGDLQDWFTLNHPSNTGSNGGDMNAYANNPNTGAPQPGVDPTWNVAPTSLRDISRPLTHSMPLSL